MIPGQYIYQEHVWHQRSAVQLHAAVTGAHQPVVGWLFGRARYIVSQRTQATLADSTAYPIERTRNLRLIKAANAQALEAELGRGSSLFSTVFS